MKLLSPHPHAPLREDSSSHQLSTAALRKPDQHMPGGTLQVQLSDNQWEFLSLGQPMALLL